MQLATFYSYSKNTFFFFSRSTEHDGSDVLKEGAASYLSQQQKVVLLPTLQGLVMVVVGDKKNVMPVCSEKNYIDVNAPKESNTTGNTAETSYMCGGVLNSNSVMTKKVESSNVGITLRGDVIANRGESHFSGEVLRTKCIVNGGQKNYMYGEESKKSNATADLSALKQPLITASVPARQGKIVNVRRELSKIQVPGSGENNDIYANTLTCQSNTTSGKRSCSFGESLKSVAFSNRESSFCDKSVSSKSVEGNGCKSNMCDELAKKSNTAARLSVLNQSPNVAVVPAMQGKTMIITRETRKISLPRIGVKNDICGTICKRSNITENCVGESYLCYKESDAAENGGGKSCVSSEVLQTITVKNTERRTCVSGEALRSNATADSGRNSNISSETVKCSAVANTGGKDIATNMKLNEINSTEKLSTLNQDQKYALLPTTLGWVMFKLGQTRQNTKNETDACGDALKNNPAPKSAENKFSSVNTPEYPVFVDVGTFAGKQRHICVICGAVFDMVSKLDLHLKTHSFLCDVCGKVLLTSDQLSRHKRAHKDRIYACNICSKTFRFNYQLNFHTKVVHSGIKNHICNICGYAAAFKSALKLHLRKHLRDFRFHCEVCGKGYHNKHSLETHMNLHTGKQSFLCNVCGKAFFFKHYLTRHKRATHPEVQEDGSTGFFRGHECQFCGRVLKHKKSLLLHMTYHTGVNRAFLCDICGKAFRTNHQLDVHKRIHTGEKPFVCDVCVKAFRTKSGLRMHMCVHTKEKRHRCDQCGKSYTQQSSLIVHKRYHTGQRPYHCQLCNKGFVTKTLLKMHQNTECI
jgi:uncharacterized Zn-finger protein